MAGAVLGRNQSQLSPDIFGELAQQVGQSATTNSTAAAVAGSQVGNIPPGMSESGLSPAGLSLPDQASASFSPPDQAREVGSLKEELVERPLADIETELIAIFSLQKLLGIENPSDTSEQKAKKAQLNQRFNQMTQEEQAVAQQHYQEQLMRKRQQEEQDLIKKQQAEAAQAEPLVLPSGPQRGPADRGSQSKAQAALQKLKQDRTTMSSNLQSAG